MAKDDDDYFRKRRREQEEEEAREANKVVRADGTVTTAENEVMELLSQAEPLIEFLNTRYRLYAGGAEKRPPTEKRTQLDSLMTRLQNINKNTANQKFRYNVLIQSYLTNRDRWDRLARDSEIGKGKKPFSGK